MISIYKSSKKYFILFPFIRSWDYSVFSVVTLKSSRSLSLVKMDLTVKHYFN